MIILLSMIIISCAESYPKESEIETSVDSFRVEEQMIQIQERLEEIDETLKKRKKRNRNK